MLIESHRMEPEWIEHREVGNALVERYLVGHRRVSDGKRCDHCNTREAHYENKCPNCGAPY